MKPTIKDVLVETHKIAREMGAYTFPIDIAAAKLVANDYMTHEELDQYLEITGRS